MKLWMKARRKDALKVPEHESPVFKGENSAQLSAAAFCRLCFPTSLQACLYLHVQKAKAHSFGS